MKELKSQLKYVKHIDGLVNPDRVWVAENKTRLMSQIANTVKPQKQVMSDYKQVQFVWYGIQRFIKLFFPRNIIRAIRPVLALVIALFITSSGWIASAYAQPGDTLWSAKSAVNTVIEKSQLAFASDTEDIKLNLIFATKRAQEIRTVVERDDVTSEKKVKLVQKTSQDLEKNLDDANEGLKHTDSENASVKDVSLKTKEIAKTLKESTEKVSDELLDEELKKDLTKQTIETQNKSLEMVETVMQKKFDAQIEITEEEKVVVKEHIEEVVATISKDTQTVKDKTDKLVRGVEEDIQKTQVKKDDLDTNSSEQIQEEFVEKEHVTSTENVVIKEKTDTEQVHEVAQKVEEAIKNVDVEKNEVQTLVNRENILEAIKKTRALTETVKQTAEEVARVSKDVFPVIQNTGIREVMDGVEQIVDVEVDGTRIENTTTTVVEEVRR